MGVALHSIYCKSWTLRDTIITASIRYHEPLSNPRLNITTVIIDIKTSKQWLELRPAIPSSNWGKEGVLRWTGVLISHFLYIDFQYLKPSIPTFCPLLVYITEQAIECSFYWFMTYISVITHLGCWENTRKVCNSPCRWGEVITNFSLNFLPNILCQLLYIAFIK